MKVRRSGPKARPEIPARSSPARAGGPGPLPASAASRRKALRWRRRVRPVDVRIDLSSLARLSSLCLVEKEPRCPVRRTVSLPMACSSCQVGKNRAGAGGAVPAGRRGRGGRGGGGRAPGRRAPSSQGRRTGSLESVGRRGSSLSERPALAAASRRRTGTAAAARGENGADGSRAGRQSRPLRPRGRRPSGGVRGGPPVAILPASVAEGGFAESRCPVAGFGSAGSSRPVRLGWFDSPVALAGGTRHWKSPYGSPLVRLACGRAVLVACGVRGAGRRRRVGRAVSPEAPREASGAGPLPADRSRSLRVP